MGDEPPTDPAPDAPAEDAPAEGEATEAAPADGEEAKPDDAAAEGEKKEGEEGGEAAAADGGGDPGGGDAAAGGGEKKPPPDTGVGERIKKDPYEIDFLAELKYPEKVTFATIPKVHEMRTIYSLGMRKVEEAFSEAMSRMHMDFEEKAYKFERT